MDSIAAPAFLQYDGLSDRGSGESVSSRASRGCDCRAVGERRPRGENCACKIVLTLHDGFPQTRHRQPQGGVLSLSCVLIALLCGCAKVNQTTEPQVPAQPASTFAKTLKSAQTGDAKAQNLIGFMLYFGELAPQNRYAAHHWFHRAADQGDAGAQFNLAVMHYLGAGVRKDLREAEYYFRLAKGNNRIVDRSAMVVDMPQTLAELPERAVMRPQTDEFSGEDVYLTFCAGCHGSNGIAAYVSSPSFALGERMEKDDAELFRTITNGRGVMPKWGNKLSDEDLKSALRFVRTLRPQYQRGIAQALRRPTWPYFLFGPMSLNRPPYDQDYGYSNDTEPTCKARE